MSTEPLVSAIMPTRGRQGWAAEAVAMFQAQTYGNKELVIIDDRCEPSFPYSLKAPGVQYHIAGRIALGGKRNMAIARASGDVIMHWDSDDIYTPDRIEHQVQFLLKSGADLVGYHRMPFVDEERGIRYEYTGIPGYCVGVSFCYWRETWEQKAFNSVDQGEDNEFLAGRSCMSQESGGRIIARIHSGNTCQKRDTIPMAPMQWKEVTV